MKFFALTNKQTVGCLNTLTHTRFSTSVYTHSEIGQEKKRVTKASLIWNCSKNIYPQCVLLGFCLIHPLATDVRAELKFFSGEPGERIFWNDDGMPEHVWPLVWKEALPCLPSILSLYSSIWLVAPPRLDNPPHGDIFSEGKGFFFLRFLYFSLFSSSIRLFFPFTLLFYSPYSFFSKWKHFLRRVFLSFSLYTFMGHLEFHFGKE